MSAFAMSSTVLMSEPDLELKVFISIRHAGAPNTAQVSMKQLLPHTLLKSGEFNLLDFKLEFAILIAKTAQGFGERTKTENSTSFDMATIGA